MKCFFFFTLYFVAAFVHVLMFDQVHIVFFCESIRMIRMKYCFVGLFFRVPQQSIDCYIQFSYCCSANLGIISEYLLLCTMHSIPQCSFGSILLNTRVLFLIFFFCSHKTQKSEMNANFTVMVISVHIICIRK